MPNAATAPQTLVEARQRIDRLDDQLLELIAQRLDLAPSIAGLKGPETPVWRPGREVALARRLAAQYAGTAPFDVVHRLFRGLIGTSIRLQAPEFTIAAAGMDAAQAVWRHFGPAQRVVSCGGAAAALSLADSDAVDLAALPSPEDQGAGPWWVGMVGGRLRVLAALPLLAAEDGPRAVLVGRQMPEATGQDQLWRVMAAEAAPAAARVLARGEGQVLVAQTWTPGTQPQPPADTIGLVASAIVMPVASPRPQPVNPA